VRETAVQLGAAVTKTKPKFRVKMMREFRIKGFDANPGWTMSASR
jgi:hypothetical protein